MNICNHTIPMSLPDRCDDSRIMLIEKIMISNYEESEDWPLALFLESVKNDPALSITLTPLDNSEKQIIMWSHVCEISSTRYRTRRFNITLA